MLRLLLAAVLVAPAAAAQGGFVLPDFPVSALEASAAQSQVAAPSNSPYAIRFNPAFLADGAERPALRGTGGLAPEVGGSDLLFAASAAGSIGIAAGRVAGGDLQIGLGGGYAEFRSDEFTIGDPENGGARFNQKETEIGVGLALGWDGPVHGRVGVSAFSRESFERALALAPLQLERDRVVTLNVGAALTVPVLPGPRQPGEIASRLELTGAYVYNDATISEDYFERPVVPPAPIAGPLAPPESQTVGVGVRVARVRQFGRRGEFQVVEAGVSAQNQLRPGADQRGVHASLVLAEVLALRAGHSASAGSSVPSDTSVGAEVRIAGIIRALGAAQQSTPLLALADRLTARGEVAVWHLGGDRPETVYYGLMLGWRP